MQMGRWFGYRKGYEDLPRIWMPYDVEYDFGKFVEKDEYMRRRIISMREQGLTPREFPQWLFPKEETQQQRIR